MDQPSSANDRYQANQVGLTLTEQARLLDLSHEAIIVRDTDNRIIYWNRGATELYGWTDDEAIGQDLSRLLHTELELPAEQLIAALRVSERMEGEVVQQTRDGRRITALCRWVLDQGAKQPPTILATYTDITERKQAEERIHRQNKVLDGIARIFSAALNSDSEKNLSRGCLDVAEDVTESQFSFIGTIHPQTGRLDDITISDRAWKVLGLDPAVVPERQVPLGFAIHDIYGQILLNGKALFSNAPAEQLDSIGMPASQLPLKAFLAVPLTRGGTPIGMIGLCNRAAGYGAAEQEMTEALAPAILQALLGKRAEKALRESEARQKFMAHLDDALRPLADPVEIQAVAARVLGEYLHVDRVMYGEVDSEDDTAFIVRQDYCRDGMLSTAGRYRFDDFGAYVAVAMREGRTLAMPDVSAALEHGASERAVYEAVTIAAYVAVPLVKNGRIVAYLAVNQRSRRAWTPQEVSLIEEVAERTWSAVERARAEMALRESEARYRTLFESIDEGFCILQIIFDEQQQPIDYRFVEINPIFEQQTGMKDALGKTMRELVPSIEPFWFEIYGKVTLSGEPTRFVDYAESMGRWFDVYAFRIGLPHEHKVAVLFNDITERKRAEEHLRVSEARQAFLLQLSDQLRPLADPAEIQRQAARVLGQYLGASRVGYAEHQQEEKLVVVTCNYTSGVPGIEGSYNYNDYGQSLLSELLSGRPVVRSNIAGDPWLTNEEKTAHAQLQTGASVNVPLVKAGHLVAILFIHYQTAHVWSADELALLQETAERTWAAVERARAEAALRESEKQFRLMADAVPQMVWFTDSEGRVEFFNKHWSLYAGVPFDPMTASEVTADFVHPDDRASTTAAFIEARRAGSTFSIEHRVQRTDGVYRWFLVRAEPYKDKQTGEIIRWFGASVDIHDRKEAETALRESEARFRAVANLVPDLLWSNDASGQIDWYNQRWIDYTGQTLEQAHDDHWLDVIHPDDRERSLQSFHAAVSSGQPLRQEHRIRRADGTYRWFLSRAQPLRDPAGTIVRWYGASSDIHEERMALAEAEAALRTRDQFLSIASHELRTPMTSLIGYAYMLPTIAARGGKQLDTMTERIVRQAQRLNALIDQLLDVSRLQRGQFVIERQPVDVAALVAPIVDEIRVTQPADTRHQIELRVPDESVLVAGDAQRLEQVIVNLLTNAIKYSPAGGLVQIRVERTATDAVVEVEDRGIGIPPDALARLSEPFYRARNVGTQASGFGLGLHIAGEIVQRHGGRIEVESTEGQGSTFRVLLPLSRSETNAAST